MNEALDLIEALLWRLEHEEHEECCVYDTEHTCGIASARKFLAQHGRIPK